MGGPFTLVKSPLAKDPKVWILEIAYTFEIICIFDFQTVFISIIPSLYV